MDNENKWEYDYSNLYGGQNRPANDTGYVNVGSSGTNTANRFNAADPSAQAGYTAPNPTETAQTQSAYTAGGAQPGGAYTVPNSAYGTPNSGYGAPNGGYAGTGYGAAPQYTAGGGTVPPQNHAKQRRPRTPGAGKKVLRGAVALVLVAAVGMGSGYAGARLAGSTGSRVVVQTVERDTATAATSTSTGGSDLSLTQVSALVSPSVVIITTEAAVYSNWFGQSSVQSGAGSGVIISADGYILTCAHVVDGASNIVVTIDDTDYVATVVGEDTDSDIAVVKINAANLTPAVVGNSDSLAVGEEVVAVGNPLGELGGTVTNGIISALNRDVTVENKKMTLIQTNASVSPGNSGGGLFNMAGELIGVVNAKSSDSDAEGLGFAIPITSAMQVAQSLIENGYVTGRPALGVTVLSINDATTAAQYGVSAYGVYIYQVASGSGAEKAGLKSGDRVISIDGIEVATSSDLTDALENHEVGDTVSLSVARSGQIMTVDVVLGEKNADGSVSAASGSTDGSTPSQQQPGRGSLNPFGGSAS